MAQLSIGYEGLVRELSTPLITAEVGKVLLGAAGDRYERMYPDCSLVQFTQSGATYLFDLASSVGAGQEDRTMAALDHYACHHRQARRHLSAEGRQFDPVPDHPDAAVLTALWPA